MDLPGENPNGSGNKSKRSKIDGMSENTLTLISKLSDEEKGKAKEYIRKQKERFANLPENLVRKNMEQNLG